MPTPIKAQAMVSSSNCRTNSSRTRPVHAIVIIILKKQTRLTTSNQLY